MLEVIDNFLGPASFGFLREMLDNETFEGVVNPVDGVFYPGILASPGFEPLEGMVAKRIKHLHKRELDFHSLFFRLSPEGTVAPQQVHTDVDMGDYTFLLYMNRLEDCQGGTSVLTHKYGLMSHPQSPEELAMCIRDQNNPSMWDTVNAIGMVPNRAAILSSDYFHRSEPVGGFGRGAKDGRLVMVAFYSEVN